MSRPHSASRTLPSLLMCRPTHYRIAYEINPWMSLKRPADQQRALAQWTALYETLQRLGARIALMPPSPQVPDLVFTANAGLVHGRILIRSNFRYRQRQREEPVIERYFRRNAFRIVSLPRRFIFEGEGDALWMGSTLVFGFRFRSDAPAHEELSRVSGAEVLPVELVDRRFYHLDTCFCPLDAKTALWYPKAFDRYGRTVIEGLVEDPISVSEREAMRFVCNAVVVGRSVVMPTGASPTLRRRLAQRGFETCTVDLSEFLKAGGSAKCLVLRLNHPVLSVYIKSAQDSK